MNEKHPSDIRTAGMDHDHYAFSPIEKRAALDWPGDARVAFSVVLYLEAWELYPPQDAVRDPRLVNANGGGFSPETRSYSYREYGNRVGIYRLFEVLDRHCLPVTVALNYAAIERYPDLVQMCVDRDWELAAHGAYASQMLSSRMSEAEERHVIQSSIDGLSRVTGRAPRGWIGQDFGESARTPSLLAEAGFDYVMDWPNDDQPYLMNLAHPLVSIPTQPAFDDVQALWLGGMPAHAFPATMMEALATLHREGGRMLSLGIHPWVFGRAHAIRYLDETLASINAHDGVWRCALGEMASWCRAAMDHPSVAQRVGD
ncbi:MAG: polysaccharide deacetylase family protein [Chromatiales bacterium]|nr:polysaccharide deacetylase family protein [Chromatiales bacterium]